MEAVNVLCGALSMLSFLKQAQLVNRCHRLFLPVSAMNRPAFSASVPNNYPIRKKSSSFRLNVKCFADSKTLACVVVVDLAFEKM